MQSSLFYCDSTGCIIGQKLKEIEMRPVLPFLLLLLVMLLIALPAPLKAYAWEERPEAKCTCAPAKLDSRWKKSAVIFTGTVRSIDVIKRQVQRGNVDLPVSVSLAVDDVYKGKVKSGEAFELQTSLTRETCTGHPFEKGRKYLVFAYERQEDVVEDWSLYPLPSGTFDVGGLCGGTKDMDDKTVPAEIEQLKIKHAENPEEE
jgi:hypothetical protein